MKEEDDYPGHNKEREKEKCPDRLFSFIRTGNLLALAVRPSEDLIFLFIFDLITFIYYQINWKSYLTTDRRREQIKDLPGHRWYSFLLLIKNKRK